MMADHRTLVHTLNNHLGIILGYADLLLDGMPHGHPNCAGVRAIRQAVVAAAALLADDERDQAGEFQADAVMCPLVGAGVSGR